MESNDRDTLIRIDETVKHMKEWQTAHSHWHEEQTKVANSRNWQLWTILLGVIISTVTVVIGVIAKGI